MHDVALRHVVVVANHVAAKLVLGGGKWNLT
jgi:hypothetical protein